MSTIDEERLMQPAKISMWPLALRYGLIIALALFVLTLILQFTGLVNPVEQKGTWLNILLTIVIFFGGLYIAVREYKKDSGNLITFGRALGFGTLTVVVICLAGLVLNWIYFQFIDPGIVEQMKEISISQMEDRGMSDEEIEQAQQFMGFMLNPVGMAVSGAFYSFLFGFIIALITAAIHQNAKPAANI